MKKSNRIAKKGATRPRKQQGTNPAKSPAIGVRRGSKKDEKAGAFSCHRLVPRTRTELQDLRKYVSNLGEHVVSGVLACGDVSHLFCHADHWILVREIVSVAEGRGQFYHLLEWMQERGESLAKFLKRRRRPRFHRLFDFTVLSKEEAAEWAERSEVVGQMTNEVKQRLWETGEINGTTKGRLVMTVHRATGEPLRRIYNRCGSFTERDEETGKARPLSRSDVLRELRFSVLLPLLDKALPPYLRHDFQVYCNECAEWPAEPADVLAT